MQPQKIAPAISAPRAPRPINLIGHRRIRHPGRFTAAYSGQSAAGRYHLEKKAEGLARGHANLKARPAGSKDPAGESGRTRPAAAAKFGVSEASVQAEIKGGQKRRPGHHSADLRHGFLSRTPGRLPLVNSTPAASRAARMASIASFETETSRSLSARLIVGKDKPVALAMSA